MIETDSRSPAEFEQNLALNVKTYMEAMISNNSLQ